MSEQTTAPISLAGRRALVTGGASGIGEAAALLFGELGAAVVISDINADGLDAAINYTGAKAAVAGDVSVEGDVARMVDGAVAELGGIDIVFNSAGVGDDLVRIGEQEVDSWQRIVDINLRGTYLVARAAGGVMLDQGEGGAMVNVSSIVGMSGFPRRSAYSAAKAGVANFTRTLACEWGEAGIRVNCIVPSYIRTPLVQGLLQRGAFDDGPIAARTPLERLGEPNEIAQAAAFLVSDWASYITGAILPVDGGWTAFGGTGDVATA